MPAFDHLGDAAQDLAFTRGLMAGEPDEGARYLRRRIAATLWIPGSIGAALLGAYTRSGPVALLAFVLLIAGLWTYAERADWVRARLTRLFSRSG